MRKDYLDIIYPQDECDEHLYPQKLCNYLAKRYFCSTSVGVKLLDIGSGKGNHLIGFSRCGYEVFGLDKRKECIDVLKDFDIRECNIETEAFPYDDESFDYLFSKSVLEHVSNTDNFMNESLRVLRVDGIAVFMCPAWESQYKFYWDDYTHVKPYTRKSLQNAMRMAGFRCVNVSYFLQLPFVWKYPLLKPVTNIVALLPDSLKWKDKDQSKAHKLVRFSKEKMLLAYGIK